MRRRKRSYRLRSLFFGRRSLGLWPVIGLLVLVGSFGGVQALDEYAAVTLPTAIITFGLAVRYFMRRSVVRRIPLPYVNSADRIDDARFLYQAASRFKYWL